MSNHLPYERFVIHTAETAHALTQQGLDPESAVNACVKQTEITLQGQEEEQHGIFRRCVDPARTASEQVMFFGRALSIIRDDIRRDLEERIPAITADDIFLIRCHRESLANVGANYAPEFLQWFRERESATYTNWASSAEVQDLHLETDDELAKVFFESFASDYLGNRVTPREHDELLAAFAGNCLQAKCHLQQLAEEAKKWLASSLRQSEEQLHSD